jgi:iron complex transport system substrate-binding protein
VKQIYNKWTVEEELERLHAKAQFYQFVYEVLRQLQRQEVETIKPDLLMQAIQFMYSHFKESITLESMASVLDCSVRNLTKQFRAKLNNSPIHFLTHIRMHKAAQLLLDTDANLQEISERIGYSDGHALSRSFKKIFGLSPIQFKTSKLEGRRMPKLLRNGSGLDILQPSSHRYNDFDNHYHHNREGDILMFKNASPSVAAVMLLCVTLLISACQSGSVNSPSPVVQNPAPATATNAEAPAISASTTTRMYEHLNGKTEIPMQPKRIFSAFHVGQLMALGVKPIGSTTFLLRNPALDVTGIEDLGVPPSLEKLVELEPDLIILTEAFRDLYDYETYSKIAPTIVIVQNDDPIKDIELFGDILGKQEEAKQWLAEFELKIAAAKQKVSAMIGPEETFSILNVRQKNFYIYGDSNMGGNILFKYLGLKPQDKVKTDVINGEVWELSAEVIPEYIGDHLFLSVNEGAEEALKNNEKIWANTDAVKNNKVYPIDFNVFLQSDPIGVSKQLDIVVDLLASRNE